MSEKILQGQTKLSNVLRRLFAYNIKCCIYIAQSTFAEFVVLSAICSHSLVFLSKHCIICLKAGLKYKRSKSNTHKSNLLVRAFKLQTHLVYSLVCSIHAVWLTRVSLADLALRVSNTPKVGVFQLPNIKLGLGQLCSVIH